MDTGANILVVDDEPTIRYYLEKVLKREGHHVMAVESGEAALERLADQDFDLALIDLKLKGIGGIEVLSALRRQWPATPAIVLTAHALLQTAVEALRVGAHDYLFKPFATEDLRESVRTALLKREQELQRPSPLIQARASAPSLPARGQPAPDSSKTDDRFLEYQQVIIDTLRHVITVQGELLDLSPTEFNLLAHLTREAPRVVSAQELVRQVPSGKRSKPSRSAI